MVQRVILILRPLKPCRKRHFVAALVFQYILSFGTIFVPLIEVPLGTNGTFCMGTVVAPIRIIYSILDTLIPITLTILCYIVIIRELRRDTVANSTVSSVKKRASKNLLINAVLTSVLFLVLVGFDRVMYWAESFGLTEQYSVGSNLQLLGLGLILVNCSLTPLVFMVCLPQVRGAVIGVICCRPYKNKTLQNRQNTRLEISTISTTKSENSLSNNSCDK